MQVGAEPSVREQTYSEDKTNVFEEAFLRAQEQQQAAKLSSQNNPLQNKPFQNKQYTDFEHVLFEYFQKRYEQTLTIIEVGDAKHQFSSLSEQDQDRLRMMQGASLLNVGLRTQGQALLLALLERTSSEYVQANTWFWLGRSAFDNKQFALSEQAYQAIQTKELASYLAFEQMQELAYQNTFIAMQSNANWQSNFNTLSTRTIYPAYILANDASMLFNAAEYELSANRFIEAKQALLSFEENRAAWLNKVGKNRSSLFSFDWKRPFTWFTTDQNAQAQGAIEAEQASTQRQEINALYDRLNLGLSYALLQQQAREEAFEVIKTVSAAGGESEQALLTFGWTLAQQNRWQNAIDVWQYLHNQSTGLYALQASYALAYAHQQNGDYSQAFFALDDTTTQISSTIDSLNAFTTRVNHADFFDFLMSSETHNQRKGKQDESANKGAKKVGSISELASALGLSENDDGLDSMIEPALERSELWPSDLLELKRFFLSKQSDIDAIYLLKVRQEADQVLQLLKQKNSQLDMLNQMLALREQRYVARQQSLSLQKTQVTISQARNKLAAIEESLADEGQNNTQNIDTLNSRMSTPEQRRHLERIANASNRLERLMQEQASENNTLRRPLNPKLQERLQRVQGIVQWQLDDAFIVRQWEHKRLLKGAKLQIDEAEVNYQRLLARQQSDTPFEQQHKSIEAISDNIGAQQKQAQAIFDKADAALRNNLLSLIELRITDLNRQQVNTRLAKLRLQDLTPEEQ